MEIKIVLNENSKVEITPEGILIVSDVVSIGDQTTINNAVVKNVHVANAETVSDELDYEGLKWYNNLSQLVGSISALQGEVTILNKRISDLENKKSLPSEDSSE